MLQHAQHGVHFLLSRSPDGRVENTLSRVFDPQDCVGSVLSGLAPVLARGAFCPFERACTAKDP